MRWIRKRIRKWKRKQTLEALRLKYVQAQISQAEMELAIICHELGLNRHTYGGTVLIRSELWSKWLLLAGLRTKEKHLKLNLGKTELDIQNLASIRALRLA